MNRWPLVVFVLGVFVGRGPLKPEPEPPSYLGRTVCIQAEALPDGGIQGRAQAFQ